MSTYKEAGVDIAAGSEAVRLMQSHVRSTFRPEVLQDIGGFGGLFALGDRYRDAVLVAGADGVGTKLKVAFMLDRHDTVGIDAVAMCVNDIIVSGADPLFFLDYLATGKIEPAKVAEIVGGVAEGCRRAGCALIGGETAEMPGFYAEGEYDLAGFAVGAVERRRLVDGSTIKKGDVLIGLLSSGLHSNGYSLARKVFFETAGLGPEQFIPELGKTLGEEMLTPTRIYSKTVLGLLAKTEIGGMAHITGGGFYENIPRCLPAGLGVVIDKKSWTVPPVFKMLARLGGIAEEEMFRTFNMGIGFVLVVDKNRTDDAIRHLVDNGESPCILGEVREGEGVKL